MGREKALAIDRPDMCWRADTVVAVGRRILPKTETEAEARACLQLMSGRRHQVLSSVVLRAGDGTLPRTVERNGGCVSSRLSRGEARPDAEITDYLAGDELRGKRRAAMPFQGCRRRGWI